MIIFAFSTLTVLLAAGLTMSLRKNLQLLDQIEDIGDTVQLCLDVLNEQHARIEQKSKLEVFYDDPIVKELVSDMTLAKDAVMEVARELDSTLGESRLEPKNTIADEGVDNEK